LKVFSKNISFFPRKIIRKNNLSCKALFILDSAPGLSNILENLVPSIRVVFLPPNTTALLQPLDEGVIAAFKAYYLCRCKQQLTY
jgi:hypothetical protein